MASENWPEKLPRNCPKTTQSRLLRFPERGLVEQLPPRDELDEDPDEVTDGLGHREADLDVGAQRREEHGEELVQERLRQPRCAPRLGVANGRIIFQFRYFGSFGNFGSFGTETSLPKHRKPNNFGRN